MTHGPVDLVINHNTAPASNSMFVTDNTGAPPSPGFIFTNNIAASGAYGFGGGGTNAGMPTLNAYYTNPVFTANAIIASQGGTYPSGNFFPGSVSAVGFVNAGAGNYALTSASAYHNAGTDGKDLGADLRRCRRRRVPSTVRAPAPLHLRPRHHRRRRTRRRRPSP